MFCLRLLLFKIILYYATLYIICIAQKGKKDNAIEIVKEKTSKDVKEIENIRINISLIPIMPEVENIDNTIENDINENLFVSEYQIEFCWDIIFKDNQEIKINVETGKIIKEENFSLEEKEE